MASPVVHTTAELERAELEAVLHSHLFVRSPTLAHLLTYLCEKKFAGDTDHIKEYSIALDVFGRGESFDQDTDSIVRVQANRLRKKLAEYYSTDGASHALHLTIPIGQYVPSFEPNPNHESPEPPLVPSPRVGNHRPRWIAVGVAVIALISGIAYLALRSPRVQRTSNSDAPAPTTQMVGLPVGDEVRILTGSARSYVDRAGRSWTPDAYFTGGTATRSSIHTIWRTQDPTIFRSSRAGDFKYDIPLKPGSYELHLYFAETFYGPENDGGGGEGSRLMNVVLNGKPLLTDFDVIADAGSARTADVKVFTDVQPASDGKLHLEFASIKGGGTLSGIELLPGARGHIRPVRIIARDVPYYSNDSRWWSPDVYFKGGQLGASEVSAEDTDDSELYETSRWGHFSYAIPVTPGEYNVVLHFIERRSAAAEGQDSLNPARPDNTHSFNVFCNGRAVLEELDIVKEAGYNHPLVKKLSGLEPNAQGKLMLEFVPLTDYATVTAIEVVPR